METLTATEAGALGGLIVTASILAAIYYILLIIAEWKIFKKAGEAGWKSLIPFYNTYIIYKISGIKAWFWYLLIVSIGCYIIATANGGIQYNDNMEISSSTNMIAIFATIFNVVFGSIVAIYVNYRLAKAFKKGIGFTLGLIFLPNIFTLILGFGSAKYDKKILKA